MERLPKVLEREPLLEAICEVRFTSGSDVPFSEVLPGALYNALTPKPQLRRLPAADIPRPLRSADPNLAFAPTMHLIWDAYTIIIGDRSFGVACGQPYPKWEKFRADILTVLGHVSALELDGHVERFSVKYVNLLPGGSWAEQLAKLKLSLKLGDMNVENDQLQLRLERRESEIIHIVSITIGATATRPDGKQLEGAIVDIDSIHAVSPTPLSDFVADLEPKLKTLRLENKRKFFSCLTEETIQSMGPHYE